MKVRWLTVPVVPLLLGLIGLSACQNVLAPVRSGPEVTCHDACRKRTGEVCSDDACWRGCNMVLDRIVEKEMDPVLACVARSKRGCADTVWSECAARVGPRVDGGPPAPETETFDDED